MICIFNESDELVLYFFFVYLFLIYFENFLLLLSFNNFRVCGDFNIDILILIVIKLFYCIIFLKIRLIYCSMFLVLLRGKDLLNL